MCRIMRAPPVSSGEAVSPLTIPVRLGGGANVKLQRWPGGRISRNDATFFGFACPDRQHLLEAA